MTLTHDDLVAIERHADRAPVQQLRLQVMQIRDDLQHLADDVADYASALLLKLGRIVDEQVTPRADPRVAPSWPTGWQSAAWPAPAIEVAPWSGTHATAAAVPAVPAGMVTRSSRRRAKPGSIRTAQRAIGAGRA